MSEPIAAPPGNSQHIWGPQTVLLVAGGALTAGAIVWSLLAVNSVDKLVTGAAVLIFALMTGVGLMMRQRLTVSASGLVIGTALGRVTVTWAQVAAISTPQRSRLGVSSRTLEIDLDDDGLLVFGKVDLGADPTEVAAALLSLWAANKRA
ncbi:PH domain-containing protein [Nakamurella antarctica]|uniref:PH domain-containing protein n=1 Tax=Nakamurella antarctica TaxID=1902245 RepID=A0A3G8ZI13_9ACTN|nr:PH domain-containing protein [Nakamurella antarctica]AZI56923.1 PH domain-containing protein [Nakamurella antarctica]